MSAVFVEITATRGSAPRDAGTAMKVTQTETEGTIGGGALEHQAIAKARQMLATQSPEQTQTLPLGPGLGQCCGGAVSLLYTYENRATDVAIKVQHALSHHPDPAQLWVWGAGHVGRAVVKSCHPQAYRITWVDSAPDRFPTGTNEGVTIVPTADMPRLAARAPTYAHHLIFTYSHDIDLALCATLLQRGAASIGLIGSDTKWARFSKRLSAMGLDPDPITCPIGDKSLGKTPHQIAQGTMKHLLSLTHPKATV